MNLNAPVVWIIVPMVIAIIGLLFRRWKTVVAICISLITLLLVLIAWQVPIGELHTMGPLAITITDRLEFVGRQFVLENSDRSMLILIYLAITFSFFGSLFAKVSPFFVPIGLGMSTVLIASLSVQPFLYAALLVETAILIGVPLLSPPGKRIEPGVLRYMTFLSFGFPFMLLGGGLLSSSVVEVAASTELLPALVVLGFGFAFLLAIFPLNTWVPVLVEKTHPYSSIFVLTLLPVIVIEILLRFVVQYPWLLDSEIIQFLGALTVFAGGLWAAFQRDLGRLLGYAVIIEIGYSLLAITLPGGSLIYTAMFLPRILGFFVWALALSIIKEEFKDLSFRSVQGIGRQVPLVVLGVLVPHFSLAGFPLFASFPVLLALWGQLAQSSSIIAFLALLSSVGLLAGALRSLAVFVMGPEIMSPLNYKINRPTQLILMLGIVAIILVGLFPQISFVVVTEIVGM